MESPDSFVTRRESRVHPAAGMIVEIKPNTTLSSSSDRRRNIAADHRRNSPLGRRTDIVDQDSSGLHGFDQRYSLGTPIKISNLLLIIDSPLDKEE